VTPRVSRCRIVPGSLTTLENGEPLPRKHPVVVERVLGLALDRRVNVGPRRRLPFSAAVSEVFAADGSKRIPRRETVASGPTLDSW
jgi:hypothetical protein